MKNPTFFLSLEDDFFRPFLDEMKAFIEQKFLQNQQQEQTTESEWMTRKDVAKYLKISLPTLHAYQNQGLITPHRIEGVRAPYYKRSEIEKLFKAKKR